MWCNHCVTWKCFVSSVHILHGLVRYRTYVSSRFPCPSNWCQQIERRSTGCGANMGTLIRVIATIVEYIHEGLVNPLSLRYRSAVVNKKTWIFKSLPHTTVDRTWLLRGLSTSVLAGGQRILQKDVENVSYHCLWFSDERETMKTIIRQHLYPENIIEEILTLKTTWKDVVD